MIFVFLCLTYFTQYDNLNVATRTFKIICDSLYIYQTLFWIYEFGLTTKSENLSLLLKKIGTTTTLTKLLSTLYWNNIISPNHIFS